jgi:asparagine synthase (glutamine-hydrolysing)
MTKYILREAMKGTLPEPIRNRRDKTGFATPQDDWFRTPGFRQYIQDLIDAPSFAARGVVNVEKAREIFKKHTEREGNYGNVLWKFINLENWYRQFID